MSFSASANQFFDRLLTPPNSARATIYAALIDGLVTDGVWPSLDAYYLFASADISTGLINLVQSTYQAIVYNPAGGAPSFTVDRGWLNVGANGNIDSTFNPSTAVAPNFTQNDALIAAWSLTATNNNNQLIRMTSSNHCDFWPRDSSNLTDYSVNTGSGESSGAGAAADSSGFFVQQRTASNAQACYRNDVLLASGTSASSAVVSETIHFSGPWVCAVGVIAKSMNATLRTALYTRTHTALVAIGATS